MFRVSHKGDGIDDADTLEGAREIVQGRPPGRYDVDEIRAGALPYLPAPGLLIGVARPPRAFLTRFRPWGPSSR
jgi:hypothetical protein